MATKSSKSTKTTTAASAPDDPTLFPIKHGVKVEQVELFGKEQERALGSQIAQAIAAGREFEVRSSERGILLLTSAADDLGQVFFINHSGDVTEVGHTEKG